MVSVFCLVVLWIIFSISIKFWKAIWIRYAAMVVFTLLIIETVTLGYFSVQVLNGKCFFLIGQDKLLDNIIKLRLSYAVYFAQGKKNFINKADDDLGYSLGKNKFAGGRFRTNDQGFRANKEYSLFPDDNHLRMVTLGDSMVFCDGEANEDAWPFILERSTDGLEVLNFGVPGYGLGQSYLRYLKYARQYHPDIIFINYVVLTVRDKIDRKQIVGLNNLRRADYYRVHFWIKDGILHTRAMSPYDLFDPEFRKNFLFDEEQILKSGNLGFLKQAAFSNVGILVKGTALQYLISSNSVTDFSYDDNLINYKILSDFLRTAQADGSKVIFFYGADFEQLPKNIQALFQANKSFVTYVNSTKAIREQIELHNAANKNLLNASNHYNPEGNRYFAEAVLKVLKSRSWCCGKRCFVIGPGKVESFNGELR